MQKSMLIAAFLLPLLVLIPVSAYAQASISVNPPENFPTGLTMSNDGMTLYVSGTNEIIVFSLSTAFDITSATTPGTASGDFPSSHAFAFQDVLVSNDGNTLYVLNNGRNTLVPYSIDGSNSYTPLESPGCCIGGALGATFSATGDWVFLGGGNVQAYSLSTPFDVSPSSASSSPVSMFNPSEDVRGLAISTDGTRLFTLDSLRIRQYNLDTPFTLTGTSTTPVDTFALPSTNNAGMDFSPNGMTMYTVSFTTDTVLQYPLRAAFTFPTIATITANAGITNGSSTNNPDITFTVRFNEDVTGFVEGDIVLTGSVNNDNPQIVPNSFTMVNAARYTFQVAVGDSPGDVTVSIPIDRATSTAQGNGNSEAIPFTATFTMVDTTPPTAEISSTQVEDRGTTTDMTVNFNVTFSAPIDESTFTASDITVAPFIGNTPTLTNPVRETDMRYSFQIQHSEDEIIALSIGENTFANRDGIFNVVQSDFYSYTFAIRPGVEITADVREGGRTGMDTIRFNATFTETVTGFAQDDIVVSSTAPDGTHTASIPVIRNSPEDSIYSFEVQRNGVDGIIMVSVPADSVEDRVSIGNTASNVFTVTFDTSMPPVIILPVIESQYVTDGEISLQFGQVSGRPVADFTFPGQPPLAAITNTGAFTWTPDTAGIFSFNATATNTDGSDIEPIILRVVNSITPLVTGDLVPDDTFERDDDDTPFAVAFSNDGLHMFVMASAGSPSITDITRYTTNTPFDFANTTSDTNRDITRDFTSQVPSDLGANDLEFSNDGRTMILIDNFVGMLYEFALDAPYTLEPRTQVDTHQLANANIPAGFTISPDGTKLFTVEGLTAGNSQVDEHTLAVPFSLSDITYERSYSLGSNPAQPQDVAFHNSTAMLVIGSNGMVYEHTVSPFTLDGASYSDNSQQLAASAVSMAAADNGLHLFVLENALDDIFRYTVNDTSRITVEISSETDEGDPPVRLASFTAAFSESVTGFDLDNINVVSSRNTHVPSNLVMINGTHYTFDVLRGPADAIITVMIPANTVGNNRASNSYTVDLEFDVSADYDLFGFEPRTFANTLDIDFSTSGGLMFILNGGNIDTIHRYDLGTEFDITTAPATPDQTFTVTRDPEPRSIEFSADRLKMFVLGADSDTIDAYVLDSPFSISPNPMYDGESLSVASATTTASGLEFSRDGLYMYVMSTINSDSRIYGFPLETAFNVTSGSANNFDESIALFDPFTIAMVISDDGTAMYTLGSHNFRGVTRVIDVYSLAVAYDVSTMTQVAAHPVVNFATRGMAFTPDFASLYIVGNAPQNRIFEYALNTGPPVLEDLDFVFTEDGDVSSSTPIPVSEPDGTVQAFRLESDAPDWMSIGAATGQLSGVVPQDNSPDFRAEDTPARCTIDGSVSFTVTVSDDNFYDINQQEFANGALDNVNRTYTVGITNNERSPNALPMVVDGVNVQVATNAVQLDLSIHTSDADAGDILTYSNIRSDVNAAIDSTSLQITPEGLATFRTTGVGGVANISYDVCDGSNLETLMVSTQSAPPALEIIQDQTINEGQTLDSLDLYITSHTESPISSVTEIMGEIGVDIFLVEEFIQITPLAEELEPGDERLNGTRQGGGSLTDDDLQRAFRISSIEMLNEDDHGDRIDARFNELFQQEADGVPSDEHIDPYNIIQTIPDDFVDANLERSPSIRIDYTFVLEDGTSHQAIFDIVVNRTDAAPISSLPAQYVFNPSDRAMVIDLADHFTDPEGDAITYNITRDSLSESVETTLGSNTVLTINPESPGLALLTVCAESQGGGGSVPNGSTCEGIAVFVRGADTIQSRIFQESSITVRHTDTDETIVLNGNNTIIDPTVLFDHIIITANDAAATGEIRINSTGAIEVLDLRLPDRVIINKTLTLSNNSGTISYNPSSDAASPVDTITFNAVLYNSVVQDTRMAPRDNSTVTSLIAPLLHDTLTVNYEFVTDDLSPVKLVPNGMPFGPRHASDYFALAVHDLFEDPDNSRPGPLDVTIAGQSNAGLTAVVGDDPDAEFSGSILGNFVVIRPPGSNHNGQTNFNFIVDDGTSTPLETSILFRFEADASGTVPVDFPQSPISRFFLDQDFEPFVIDFEDLIAGGNATFVEAISITNLRLPDGSSIDVSEFNATHHMVSGTSNFESETMLLDVVRQDDASVTLFENYRVAFSTDSPPPQVSSSGSDDSRWKSKATFGKSYSTGLKSVDCGYSMDGTCRNVTDYHVNYLRDTITTDSYHDFTLKTSAPNGLRSLGIAFGVPGVGSSLNTAEALVDVTLERDYTLNSTYRITDVTYTNENNVIGEDAGFSIQKSKCQPSDPERECVTLNIDGVQFREQMYHAPFVIHAMDTRGYVTIHYMNDGLLISGDSLNEPPTHDLTAKLAHQRDLAQLSLTRTDKLSDVWTDQFGYTWTKNSYGTWSYVEGPKIVVSPICDDPDKRVCNAFAQKLAAHNIQLEELRDSLYGKAYTMPAFDDLHETVTIYDIDGDSRERFLADNDLLWLLE